MKRAHENAALYGAKPGMKRLKRLAVFVGLAVAVIAPQRAKADGIYYSGAYLGGAPYNYVPLANDGTPNRPIGSKLGNTITLGGTLRNLTTIDIGLFSGGGSGQFTLDLYGGSDPNTATLLGSETTNIGGGIYPVQTPPYPGVAVFDFTSLHIVLPDVVTFVITGVADDNGHGPLSGLDPTTGTAADFMWYGNGPGSFVQNDTWAQADGAGNNLINAQVNAVPEPTSIALLATMLLGVGITCRRAFGRV